MLTAKSIEFSAETKVSGIEFVPLKETKTYNGTNGRNGITEQMSSKR